jgi:hypothetical protein
MECLLLLHVDYILSTLPGLMKTELQASAPSQSHEPILEEQRGQASLPLLVSNSNNPPPCDGGASICSCIQIIGSILNELLGSVIIGPFDELLAFALVSELLARREYSRPPAVVAQYSDLGSANSSSWVHSSMMLQSKNKNCRQFLHLYHPFGMSPNVAEVAGNHLDTWPLSSNSDRARKERCAA